MCVIIHKLYGVEPMLEAKFKAQGIRSSEDLLKICRTPREIAELARATGVDVSVITRLLRRAELARIRGIGGIYTKLLEEAGISSTRELASSSPEDLRARLTRLNADKQLVGRVPALAMVNGWVNKAQRMPRVLK